MHKFLLWNDDDYEELSGVVFFQKNNKYPHEIGPERAKWWWWVGDKEMIMNEI